MPEEAEQETCPRCGSSDVEAKTQIDLAFGEEVPYRSCRNCGNEYAHGTPSGSETGDS